MAFRLLLTSSPPPLRVSSSFETLFHLPSILSMFYARVFFVKKNLAPKITKLKCSSALRLFGEKKNVDEMGWFIKAKNIYVEQLLNSWTECFTELNLLMVV
jgi:hypothetical protein